MQCRPLRRREGNRGHRDAGAAQTASTQSKRCVLALLQACRFLSIRRDRNQLCALTQVHEPGLRIAEIRTEGYREIASFPERKERLPAPIL